MLRFQHTYVVIQKFLIRILKTSPVPGKDDLFPLGISGSAGAGGDGGGVGAGGDSSFIVPGGSSGRSVSLTQTANESLLLDNLHKLEEAGKVISPKQHQVTSSEVSARDIVTGIISAANRKIQRGQQHSGSSSSVGHHQGRKKDSMMDPSELAGSRYEELLGICSHYSASFFSRPSFVLGLLA